MRRYLPLAGLLALLALPMVSPAQAQESRYSFDGRGMALDTALAAFTATTKIGVIYSSPLVAGKTTTCVIRQAAPDDVLRCILEGTGLAFDRLSTGTYTLKPRPDASSPTAAVPRRAAYTLSGYVRDANTGEALFSAAVYDQEQQAGTTTNAYGFFSLTVPPGPLRLVVSYLGYEKARYAMTLDADVTLHVDLRPTAIGLDTLVVEAGLVEALERQTQMSAITLPVRQVQALPALLGEPDVLRAIQLLPGVQSGNEGTTGLYVRGGGVDQNLVLLDGAPVYNPSHLFGFLSIFHARVLNDITLIKGGFPARYGGRLSSVLDVSMKEGNTKRMAGEASVGLAAGSLTLEGPLRTDRTAFIVSGRRSFIDVASRPFTNENDFPAYTLFDFNAKVNHRFSDKDRVYLSFYGGQDRYVQRNAVQGTRNAEDGRRDEIRNEFGIGWGNLIGTLRWNHLFSDKLFGNTLLFHSRYRLQTTEEDLQYTRIENTLRKERYRLRYDSGVSDWGLKTDFDFLPAPRHRIRFGVQAVHHTFRTGTLQTKEEITDAPPQETVLAPVADTQTGEGALYLEDDLQLGAHLGVNLGIHASAYRVDGTTYTSVQPRISARYLLPFDWALKASYARMTQYLHLLVNSGLGLPTDLWLPATKTIKPQASEQVAAGLAHTVGHGFEVSLEGYYKTMDGVIEYKEGANFLDAGRDWQDNVEVGTGQAYGVELFVQKRTGRTTGWLGYTLSRTDRRFDTLNEGRVFPFRYDRRHDVALNVIHRVNGWLTVSGSWVYGTGNAVTIADTRFSPAVFADASGPRAIYTPNGEVQRLGARNGFRMPAYHRLDLGAQMTWTNRHGAHMLAVGLYNTYNHKNPYFLFAEQEPILGPGDIFTDGGVIVTGEAVVDREIVVKQASLFPLLPSLSYSFRF